jgi:hypothetical protein
MLNSRFMGVEVVAFSSMGFSQSRTFVLAGPIPPDMGALAHGVIKPLTIEWLSRSLIRFIGVEMGGEDRFGIRDINQDWQSYGEPLP